MEGAGRSVQREGSRDVHYLDVVRVSQVYILKFVLELGVRLSSRMHV
jgi:hypothetical protein